MKFKYVAGAAALVASSASFAGTLTGNVGAVSDYMFRGIDQTGGAAVQGGVDYGFDFGMYTGLWISNSAVGQGNEADIYAGYDLKLGQFNLNAGAIYYLYSEEDEVPTDNKDYAEVFVGGGIGPVALKVFYAPSYGGDNGGAVSGDPDKNELLYVTASAVLTLNDTVSFTPQIGFTSGDGAKDTFGDEYTDYSITATKKLKDDTSVSLSIVNTDVETAPDTNDQPKFVIGFKREFKI